MRHRYRPSPLLALGAAALCAAAPLGTPLGAQILRPRASIEPTDEPIVVKQTSTTTTLLTRADTVKKAYTDGAAQNPGVSVSSTVWTPAANVSGLGYAEMVGAWKEIATSGLAYRHTLERAPTGDEVRQQIAALRAGRNWRELWRDLATSPERDQRFGHFAPAPLTPAEAQTKFALPVQREGEQCFGGVGDRCEGGVPPELIAWVQPQWTNQFTMPDGTRMGYVTVGVVVGSILHDNACLALTAPGGLNCNGIDWGADLTKTSATPAAMEWNKAWWNTKEQRGWRATFGPYPLDVATRRSGWYDDLRPMPARSAMMAPVFGPLALPALTEPYRGGERKSSRRLQAPAGTKLDHTDAQFCAAGSFGEMQQPFGQVALGVCR